MDDLDNRIKKKVCVVGNSYVGKTSIIDRTIHSTFQEKYQATIPVAFQSYPYTCQDHTEIEFQIWDTAGQEDYHSLVPLYYNNSDVILIVYDVTSSTSFQEIDRWMEQISHRVDDSLIILVGNKIDLQNERQVEFSRAQDYANQNNFTKYFEVSAKTGEGIDGLWSYLADECPEIKTAPQIINDIKIEEPHIVPETSNNQSYLSWLFSYC